MLSCCNVANIRSQLQWREKWQVLTNYHVQTSLCVDSCHKVEQWKIWQRRKGQRLGAVLCKYICISFCRQRRSAHCNAGRISMWDNWHGFSRLTTFDAPWWKRKGKLLGEEGDMCDGCVSRGTHGNNDNISIQWKLATASTIIVPTASLSLNDWRMALFLNSQKIHCWPGLWSKWPGGIIVFLAHLWSLTQTGATVSKNLTRSLTRSEAFKLLTRPRPDIKYLMV